MLYVIINPKAGSGKGAAAKKIIQETLSEKNADFAIFETEYKAHAVELAKTLSNKPDCEGIIAAGGDGTFYEVLNGMNLSVSLGLIPCGTGNDFAKAAGISTDVKTAALNCVCGEKAPIDFLQVGEKRCLNVAGMGFDVEVLKNEPKYRKIFHGKAGYYASLFVTLLAFKFRKLTLTTDGESRDTEYFMFSAANGKYFGGGMPIAPFSINNDGLIDVVLIRKMPRIVIPYLLIKFLSGKVHTVKKYVDTLRCREIFCDVSGNKSMQLDGEIMDILPTKITIIPGGITLMGNRSSAAK